MELGKGEALVSFLEGNGTPSEVERAMIRPPTARIGPITPEERKAVMNKSPVKGKYDKTEDRESAFEMLQKRLPGAVPGAAPGDGAQPTPTGPQDQAAGGWLDKVGAIVATVFGTNVPRNRRLSTGQKVAREVTRSVSNQVFGQIAADIGKSIAGSTGRSVGRSIVRSTLGGIMRR
jgi:hypothetical protein